MKHEVILYALGMEGTDRWMMTDLLRDPSEPQILSNDRKNTDVVSSFDTLT